MATQPPANAARENMVNSQITPNQVNDSRVIAAMRTLPREAFAPAGSIAYGDADISLGEGRFLLSPMVTARLAQIALSNNPQHVLVVGAGSGYLAAVLAKGGAHVVALESEARLNTGALAQYTPNVSSVSGKLAAGWPASGPYDVIVIEGAVPAIPETLIAQLTPGGRVVTILADGAEPAGLGRAVVAEPAGKSFAVTRIFDCTARILPEFRRQPSFSF